MRLIKRFIPTKLSRNPAAKNGNVQQRLLLTVCIPFFVITLISLLVAGVSYYLITFIVIVMSLLLTYVLVASLQHSQFQTRTLSNLIESMIDGDYSLRGRAINDQASQELLILINSLADTLHQHKIEAKESRLLLERIMEQMDAMVLAVDDAGCVVMANNSAQKLLLEKTEDYIGTDLATLPVGDKLLNAETGVIEFKLQQLVGEHFLFTERFLSEGKPHQLYLLTNAERLLMEKERQAWQNLLRVLSHEINNSLTPIATISQSIQKKLVGLNKSQQTVEADALLPGIDIINERADSLSNFINSYSQLSHLPKPVLTEFSVKLMVEKLEPLFPDCKFQWEGEESDIGSFTARADKNQFEQVLINLFKNAQESMVDEKLIEIAIQEEDKWLYLTINDIGTGIANEDNLFVPFYSTKKQGSGIGLALCRQVLFNHHGLITLNNRKDKQGASVKLALPR